MDKKIGKQDKYDRHKDGSILLKIRLFCHLMPIGVSG